MKLTIDVWNISTFDSEVLAALERAKQSILAYFREERKIFDDREASSHRLIMQNNRFYTEHQKHIEEMMAIVEHKIIRAWHYARLTVAEVEEMLSSGIYLTTSISFKSRLDKVVASGELSEAESEQIYKSSVLVREPGGNRANRFWVTSNPVTADNGNVELLLRYWGGEVAYFWQEDQFLLNKLVSIGTPCVIEIAMPLALTNRVWECARSLISTYSNAHGIRGDFEGFDACTMTPLSSDAITRVYRIDDPSYLSACKIAAINSRRHLDLNR